MKRWDLNAAGKTSVGDFGTVPSVVAAEGMQLDRRLLLRGSNVSLRLHFFSLGI